MGIPDLTTDEQFESAACALCSGLFGDAYGSATEQERNTWVRIAKEAIRKAQMGCDGP
jgi:hypothetical protein